MIVEVIRGLNMGGAETLLLSRLRHASVSRPPGYDETVVVNMRPDLDHYRHELQVIGIRVIDVPYSDPVRGGLQLRRVLSSLEGTAATVVFHSPVTTYVEKLRRSFGLRSSYRMVDVVHSTRYRRVYSLIGAVLDRFADLAIAVSDDVAKADTSAHYRRAEVVLAGADVERMREWVAQTPDAPLVLRSSVGATSQERVVVSVGSLIPLKGHRYMIRALADERLRDVRYVLVGDGPERANLEALADELGVSDRVAFVGRVRDGWRWTAVADAIVHPSEFEGLPVALMEAAALGTPIVGTRVGGIEQIITKGAKGRLLPSQSPEAIVDIVFDILKSSAWIEEIFPDRAVEETYWSVTRYARDFYAKIVNIGETGR